MSQAPATEDRPPLGIGTPAFFYVLLCSVSLVVLLFIEVRLGQGPVGNLLLLVVGGLGILTRLRVAPLLLLVFLAVNTVMRRYLHLDFRIPIEPSPATAFRIIDILTAVSVLGYFAGHYRLQALYRHIFPPDYRLAAIQTVSSGDSHSRSRPSVEQRRSLTTVMATEQVLLIIALPVCAFLGHCAWLLLSHPPNILEWDPWVVRLALLLMVMVLGMTVVAGLLGAFRRRRMTPEQAALLVNDTLWQVTRGEQRWFTRWLAWFWLKERERKEQS
jgi:hypothetical protein